MRKFRSLRASLVLALSAGLCGISEAQLLDTEFTYQGLLTDGGSRVDGTADFEFYLYDAQFFGAVVAGPLNVNNVAVDNGVFTATIDFGAAAFNGNERWLRINVRSPSGGGAYTTLVPRQNVTSAPYASQVRGIFVDANRLVGINTTNPIERLHVAGAILADGPGYDVHLNANSPSSFRVTDLDGDLSAYVFHSSATDGGQWVAQDAGSLITGIGANNANGNAVGLFLDYEHRRTNVRIDSDQDGDATNGSAVGVVQVASAGNGTGGVFEALSQDGQLGILLDGGSTTGGGLLQVLDADSTSTFQANANSGDRGGELYTYSEDGFSQLVVQPDFDGSGSFMGLRRNNSSFGLLFNGNSGGSENPLLQVTGTTGSFSVNLASTTSDGMVVMPAESVNSTELLNEPGVASATEGFSSTALTGTTITTIQSRTIDCPSSGYVLVLGTCQPIIDHTSGVQDSAIFGVSDVAGSFPVNQDVGLGVGTATGGGQYTTPVSVHGLFSVSAGVNTFYLLGQRTSGDPSISVFDHQLTCVYLPTAYGTVEGTLVGPSIPDSLGQTRGGMTQAEIESEQIGSILDNLARRDAELAALQAEMAQLRTLMEADLARGQGLPPATEERRPTITREGELGDTK